MPVRKQQRTFAAAASGQKSLEALKTLQEKAARTRNPETLRFLLARALKQGMTAAARCRELERENIIDPLTGLANRRGYETAMAALLKKAQAGQGGFCLLLLDCDKFKTINDTMGHATGDEALRRVAAALRDGVQMRDAVIARFGGDEFAVLLPDTTLDQAAGTVQRVLSSLEKPPFMDRRSGETASLSLSTGGAAWRRGDTSKRLFMRADEALYAAKSTGRGAVITALSCRAP